MWGTRVLEGGQGPYVGRAGGETKARPFRVHPEAWDRSGELLDASAQTAAGCLLGLGDRKSSHLWSELKNTSTAEKLTGGTPDDKHL